MSLRGLEETWDITLKKTPGTRLGVSITRNHDFLLVMGINDGIVQAWNDDHPDDDVRPGDRFVEVNGISGAASELLAECSKDGDIHVTVARPVTRLNSNASNIINMGPDSKKSGGREQRKTDRLAGLNSKKERKGK